MKNNVTITSKPNYRNNIYELFDENNNKIKIPESIAIILDGNGRYAKKHNLNMAFGHKAGCETLEVILEECVKINVKYLTVYAFSTENWKRSEEEINALFSLFNIYLDKIKTKAIENDVKINFIGDLSKFPKNIIDSCNELINITMNNHKLVFSIAFNYGGRDEIIRAIKKIYNDNFNIEDLNEEVFSNYLDTYDIKDPDLLIRTSGELRISNFLLWQLAYSEFYITDTLWPEFNVEELYKAIYDYNKRERRFGGR